MLKSALLNRTYPAIKEDPGVWLEGLCFWYSAALHSITGWPEYTIEDAGDGRSHYVVKQPDGLFLDAGGSKTIEQVAKEHHLDNPKAKPLPDSLSFSRDTEEEEFQAALSLAQKQLGQIRAGAVKASSKPNTLYHSIEPYYRAFIQEHGLIPAKYSRKGIYLMSNIIEAELEEPESFDHWEVNVEGLTIEPDEMGWQKPDKEWGTPWYVCHDSIPPQRLTLVPTEFTPSVMLEP